MKIFVVSQCFYPEEFKINDLVATWVEQGHDVTVLTGKPNYPKGRYFDGYRFWGVQKETYKGARVIRVPLIRRGKSRSWQLVINYLSFVFFGCWYVLFHRVQADAAFCFALSPIIQAYPALLLKRKAGVKTSIWVQDLWPESVSAIGAIRERGIAWRILSQMVTNIYRKCDTIFIQSPAFKDSICRKGDFENRIVYAPNWAESWYVDARCNKEKYKHLMPEGFKVMFAGNIGKAQDFDSIIKAAERTRHLPQIKWVVVGDGRARSEVENLVRDRGLTDTVAFLGRYSAKEMPDFFVHADVLLVTLRSVEIFALTIPSKLQTYMAFGKPVLAMLDGVSNTVIEEAECGLTAVSGDYEKLAANVIRMYESDETELKYMAENAKTYYRKHFSKDKVIKIISNNL